MRFITARPINCYFLVLYICGLFAYFFVTAAAAERYSRQVCSASELPGITLLEGGDIQAVYQTTVDDLYIARETWLRMLANGGLVEANVELNEEDWHLVGDYYCDFSLNRTTDLFAGMKLETNETYIPFTTRMRYMKNLYSIFPPLFDMQMDTGSYVAMWLQSHWVDSLYYPRIAPEYPLCQLAHDHDVTYDYLFESPFYAIATPTFNPARSQLWTDPYEDSAGKPNMISSVLPVCITDTGDVDKDFFGVFGVDVLLSETAERLDAIKASAGGFALLFNLEGFLISSSTRAVEALYGEGLVVEDTVGISIKNSAAADIAPLLQTMVEATELTADVSRLEINGQDHYWAYYRLSAAPWIFAVAAPVEEVDSAVTIEHDSLVSVARAEEGVSVTAVAHLYNQGSIDLSYQVLSTPSWVLVGSSSGVLAAGDEVALEIEVPWSSAPEASVSELVMVMFTDDNYPDCFLSEVKPITVSYIVPIESSNDDAIMVVVVVACVAAVALIAGVAHFRNVRLKQKISTLESVLELTPEQEMIVAQVMGVSFRSYVRSSSQADPSPGEEDLTVLKISFDEVTMVKKIGAGGFGEVWKAQYRNFDVAVKRLITSQIDEDNLRRFRGELILMSKLNHPNIVRLYGGCWDPPNICIVLELLERGGLDTLLRDPEQAAQLLWSSPKMDMLLGVARALEYIHALDPMVVHRDVKAANVLVGRGHDVRLGDFGEARGLSEETMTTVGSVYWTAPEVSLGDIYDEKADVFSFSMVILEMMIKGGHLSAAYPGRGDCGVTKLLIRGDRPKLAKLQLDDQQVPGLRDLMQACWDHDPLARPAFSKIVTDLVAMQTNMLHPGSSGPAPLVIVPVDVTSLSNKAAEKKEGGGGEWREGSDHATEEQRSDVVEAGGSADDRVEMFNDNQAR